MPEGNTGLHQKSRGTRCLKAVSNKIIWALESLFYRLGKIVATHPIVTISLCIILCGLFSIGLKDFKEINEAEKLWVPSYSRVQREKKWVWENFPPDTRYASLIFVEENILSTRSVRAMYDFYQEAVTYVADGNKYDSMCLYVGHVCHVSSLLELWMYNKTMIYSLNDEDILSAVNNVKVSPMFHKEIDMKTILGQIQRDAEGKIIGAKAATMLFLIRDQDKWRNSAMQWEMQIIQMANKGQKCLDNVYVYASRSFDDEGYGAVNNDIKLLSAGFSIVLVYLFFTLGRVNCLEHKLFLSLAGLVSVGLSIGFAYGLAIACGVIYGPVHSLMPFLLLGIGVDDMFVIIEAWKNLVKEEEERKRPLPERIALTMKHAGVSVTVTSLTDIVAFAIGGSTVIPGLSGFCIYAALGILALYILQSTFFVACLTLDQRRVEATRDACLCCIVHKDYQPNSCSQKHLQTIFFEKYYGPFLMKFPVKLAVLAVTLVVLGVNSWGFYNLQQDFDLTMYIPAESYAHKYSVARDEYFPAAGVDVSMYCGNIDYSKSKNILDKMFDSIASDPGIENGTIVNWFSTFTTWLQYTRDPTVIAQLGPDNYPVNEAAFNALARYFIHDTSVGQAFSRFVQFDVGKTPPTLEAMFVAMRHTNQPDSKSEIKAMEQLRDIIDNSGLPKELCFPYCSEYLTYETNKILQEELYRNLLLAGACVFVVTLLLIANLWTSIIVFTCVIFTLVDVAGTLHLWGVTIDTASSILLTLSVGLAVDYSAHIGHTYMTVTGNKNDRPVKALTQIGPAVFNGGFSTFLAFVLLARSNSYGFSLFFRVFFSVVLFGLFHGLAYLPVILSWIGPDPYDTGVGIKELSMDKVSEDKSTNGNANHTVDILLEPQQQTILPRSTHKDKEAEYSHTSQDLDDSKMEPLIMDSQQNGESV